MHRGLRNSASALAIAVGTAWFGCSANAADLVPAPAPIYQPLPQVSWGGFYAGAHIGAGQAEFSGVKIAGGDTEQYYFDEADNVGVLGGGQIGYNFDHGHFVFGIEADLSLMDWSDEVHSASSDAGATEVDMLGSVRGRIGVPVDDDRSVLLYATAGLAFADAEAIASPSELGDTSQVHLDFDDVGAVFGAGVEWAHSRDWRLRGELLYYNFDESADINALGVGNTGSYVSFDDAITVRVGISRYFH